MYDKETQTKKSSNKARTRKCLTCREWFKPKEIGVTTCSEDCAILYGISNFRKQKVKEKRKAKIELNNGDIKKLTKIAQYWFNKFIRSRDKDQPCISCGHTGNRQRHAGHFKPVGSNYHIRFDENNCHSQCSICNNHLSGNLSEYEPNLVLKIGVDEVRRLKTKIIKKWTIKEIKEIIKTYKRKVKDINDYQD